MKKIIFLTVILLYDTFALKGQWTYSSLAVPTDYMGVTVSGSKVYFAGGEDCNDLLSLVEIYDASTGSWNTDENLSVARELPFATTCGSKVIFAGGVDFYITQQVFSTIDIYDTLSGEWTVEELSVPRLQAAVVSHGDTVLFAGGTNYQTGATYDIVEMLNVQTGEWSTAMLSEPRTTWWAKVGNLAIFAGGYSDQQSSKRVDIYNFATQTWSVDSLSVPRAFIGMTTIGNKVLIAGGMVSGNTASNVVDIYDAVSGSWDTAYLSVARAFADNQQAVTAGGKAYFVGGGKIDLNEGYWTAAYDVIDIYEEATNTWSVDTMPIPIRVHHAVAAADNKVIIAGGYLMEPPYGCDNAVAIYTCPPSSCLPTGIVFSSQEEIDHFQVNHPTCNEVIGDVIINGTDISNLMGLSILTSIGGNLTIYNTSLTDLTGLENIAFIGGDFSIGMDFMGCHGNNSLTSLIGMDSLTTVGGSLNIRCNEILADLSGIEQLNSIAGDLSIQDNPALTNCAAQSICEYLSGPNGEINISGNKTGCNSPEEVEEACANVGFEESPVSSQQSAVIAYPNPTSGIVDFQFSIFNGQWPMANGQRTILKVYNAQGQEVATVLDGRWPGDQVVRWDASGLPAGVYYYRLQAADSRPLTGKIVKY